MTDKEPWEWYQLDNFDSTTYFKITCNSDNAVDIKIPIFFSNGDVDTLIRKCPFNCPMKRGDKCIASKCILDYPEQEES